MGKKAKKTIALSKRETQIMDIVYAQGECSVSDVLKAMHDPPGYSSVRKLLTILMEKGHLKYREDGAKYIYRPTKPRHKAGQSALARVVATFYENSLEQAVAAMLSQREFTSSSEELQRLADLIEEAKQERNQ